MGEDDFGSAVLLGPDGAPVSVVIPELDLPEGRRIDLGLDLPEGHELGVGAWEKQRRGLDVEPGAIEDAVEALEDILERPGSADSVDAFEDAVHRAAVEESNENGWPEPYEDELRQTMVALRVPQQVGERYGFDAGGSIELESVNKRHITVVYLGELPRVEVERLRQSVREWVALSEWQPMTGHAQGWGTFNRGHNDKSVLWMGWDVDGLGEMRNDLCEHLHGDGFEWDDDHEFIPHETVGYAAGPVRTLPQFPGYELNHTFDGITVAAEDDWIEYPFQSGLVCASGRTAVVAALEAAVEGMGELTDDDLDALIAAGGADRNRGNAEKLRRYWTVGKGGAKIRWGTKGDWERCVKHLRKHMGPRAKGYCQLRHHEMTGMYTGDMKHRIMYGWGGKPGSYWKKVAAKTASGNPVLEVVTEPNLMVRGSTAGGAMVQDPDDPSNPLVMLMPPQPELVNQKFFIPLLLPEGVESGDGRTFEQGVVEVRDMPIPLLWQPNSMQGHDGAMIVGRIDSVERTDAGVGNARGVFDTSPVAQEAVRMIREGFLRGVSADLDKFEAKILGKGGGTSEAKEKSAKEDDDDVVAPDRMSINQGRIMAATLVAKPAFDQAAIQLVEDVVAETGPAVLADGVVRGEVDPALRLSAAKFMRRRAYVESQQKDRPLVASVGAVPVKPPAEWFEDPRLGKPTHLTIDDDGRVFGHIAAWGVDHIGMGFGTRPPKSKSNYSYFRTGLLRTAEGKDVRVGQITLTGGHASLNADAREAVRHYDDTQSAFADVVAGEDRHGIWVAGALRPEVTDAQVRAARASSPSGDWRPIGGKLELVAVCQVNVPGFPVVEARVAGGAVLALVAAGTTPLLMDMFSVDPLSGLRRPVAVEPVVELVAEELSPVDVLNEVVAAAVPERKVLSIREAVALRSQQRLDQDAAAVRDRMASLKGPAAERRMTIRDAAVMLFASKEADQIRSDAMIASAKMNSPAMPDGSFSIKDVKELQAAIEGFGGCAPDARTRVKNHIRRRAAALGAVELLPSWWVPAPKEPAAELAAEELSRQPVSTERRESMAKRGLALDDGSFPIADVADLKRAIHAYGRAKESHRAAVRRHIIKRARALKHPELIPDNWSKAAASPVTAATYQRRSARESADSKEGDRGRPTVAGGTLRRIEQKARDVERQSRDDVGRWRKIYYRLRQSEGGQDWKIKRAEDVIGESEKTGEPGTVETTEKVRRDLVDLRLSSDVDERVRSEIVRSAAEAAGLMHRLDVRGPDTLVSFGQLPAEVQDALKRYFAEEGIEERITKHFVPFVNGEINRSVKDILNLVERVVIDNQRYRKGYDKENV